MSRWNIAVSLFSGFKWNISGLSLLLRNEFMNRTDEIKKLDARIAFEKNEVINLI